MANEAARINNPDSVPGLVSTGYQLQNTNIVASRVGMDATVVTGGTGQCVLEISGPVDVNGVLYSIGSAVTFNLSVAGTYYIHLAGSGNNLTPTIGTGANTFDPDKNARYTDTGSYRVLNWVVYFDGVTAVVDKLLNPQNAENRIEKLIIGEISMYAYGLETLTTVNATSAYPTPFDTYTGTFDILKPCYVHFASYMTNRGSVINGAVGLIYPGTYRIRVVGGTDAGFDSYLYRQLDTGLFTEIYKLDDSSTGGTELTDYVKLNVTYAEGLSDLDVSKIMA